MQKLSDTIEKNSSIWLLGIISLAIFFRVFNYYEPSLWTDEFSTLWVSSAPSFAETYKRAAETQGMHPLYFLISHAIISVLPVNEGVLRGLSCVASIMSIFFIFLLAKLLFKDDIRGLLAAAIFAIHADSVYYAQEARPYALAVMFALISQIAFLRFSQNSNRMNSFAYVISSALAIYMHYTFASLLVFQNAYYIFSIFKKDKINSFGEFWLSSWRWFLLQFICFILLTPALPHIISLYGAHEAWTWLRNLDFLSASKMFFFIFDPILLGIMLIIGIIFSFFEAISLKNLAERLNINATVFLILWLFTPFICVLFVSKVFGVPFFDPRYMLLSMPAYYILLANLLDIFRSDVLRTAFPGIYLIVYLGSVSIPDYMYHGVFCRHVPHNWRAAITHVKENFSSNDAVLLRYGEIKENWIPSNSNPIIDEYVKAPFYSFYWGKELPTPKIFNLTYSWEKDFYNYYDYVFNELLKYERIWLIGVNPPNTNYRISSVAQLMDKDFPFKKIWEANYNGVYLALLETEPAARRKAKLPPYAEELRQNLKRERKNK